MFSGLTNHIVLFVKQVAWLDSARKKLTLSQIMIDDTCWINHKKTPSCLLVAAGNESSSASIQDSRIYSSITMHHKRALLLMITLGAKQNKILPRDNLHWLHKLTPINIVYPRGANYSKSLIYKFEILSIITSIKLNNFSNILKRSIFLPLIRSSSEVYQCNSHMWFEALGLVGCIKE